MLTTTSGGFVGLFIGGYKVAFAHLRMSDFFFVPAKVVAHSLATLQKSEVETAQHLANQNF